MQRVKGYQTFPPAFAPLHPSQQPLHPLCSFTLCTRLNTHYALCTSLFTLCVLSPFAQFTHYTILHTLCTLVPFHSLHKLLYPLHQTSHHSVPLHPLAHSSNALKSLSLRVPRQISGLLAHLDEFFIFKGPFTSSDSDATATSL